ncbi:hypothetical protein E4T38_08600 [Aureobasidium subglaciale]|nr:hypothetical protein E4T38_08600 [Aureobasidium subglaciale]KAI5215114.1 hypothetical protein E4T40_08613 [Aureobasidium subglaciale]KAI5218286.1 hypothetical protein E4T41_08467 [Aureobasidium subglaciale]KAI5256026.1 hypothetical protein E4T46_08501 [Aureobasidium subglaciale]
MRPATAPDSTFTSSGATAAGAPAVDNFFDYTILNRFSSLNTNSPAFTTTDDSRLIRQSDLIGAGYGQSQTERAGGTTQHAQTGEQLLFDYFKHRTVPPILAPVETQQHRRVDYSALSPLKLRRFAVTPSLTYALEHRELAAPPGIGLQLFELCRTRRLYTTKARAPPGDLLLLSYVDIIEGRTEAAYGSLKEAYTVFDKADKTSFGALEIRVLS